MKILHLTWNCDGYGTVKINDDDNVVFKTEFSHRSEDESWKKEGSLIMDTFLDDKFKKKRQSSALRTPISEDILWTDIWERELTDEEFLSLKNDLMI